MSQGEMVIRELYEITSRFQDGFDHQVHDLLELGCRRFGMEVAILSRVEGQHYEVLAAIAPAGVHLSRGQEFELDETFCGITVAADGPVGIEHLADSDLKHHSAYDSWQLESYLGTPVRAPSGIVATLSFGSFAPRDEAFTRSDVDCLQLMAGWLGTELERRRVEHELAAAQAQLEQQAQMDPLTALLNRRGLEKGLHNLITRPANDGTSCTGSALLVDLDDFKGINDAYGHSVGDTVLQAVAETLRAHTRPTDLVARVGGDEFMVFLPGADRSEAVQVAERIRVALDRYVFADIRGLHVTASLGVAAVERETRTVADLIRSTERRLKASKRAGKNTVSQC